MLEDCEEKPACPKGADTMEWKGSSAEGKGSTNEKGNDRRHDGPSYVRNSPASPLVCSHVVESDFAASVDRAVQGSSAVDDSSALLTDNFTNASKPEIPSSTQRRSSTEREPRLVAQPQSQGLVRESERNYFAPRHILNHTNYLPLTSTTPTDPSPGQSLSASSSSRHSRQPIQSDAEAATFKHQERPRVSRDLSSVSTASTQTIVPTKTSAASARPPTSYTPVSQQGMIDLATAPKRRDGPIYPNQAFSVLQSQVYPPPYQPHPLRTRSSHPSQHSTYSSSAGSTRHSRENPDMKPGSRTAGNTPSPSPGLFTPSFPSPTPTSETDDDTHYSSPFLHPSHRQAPKE